MCGAEHTTAVRAGGDLPQWLLLRALPRDARELIPLNLDGKLFEPQWEDWKKQHLTTRMAANFVDWEKDNQIFETQFELVVKALRADASAREKPPEPRL